MKVFISYARADKPEVIKLVKTLEDAGISVWWDKHLVPGSDFRDAIAANLNNADKVIVVWSTQSIASTFVRDEAARGLRSKKLVPIRIADVDPPVGFGEIHTADCSTSYDSLLSALGETSTNVKSVVGVHRRIRPSKLERLILLNQYEILCSIDPSQKEDHEITMASLRRGYVDRLRIDDWLDDELEASIHEDVFNILEMHRALRFGFNQLTDKTEIDELRINFAGFDGNYESSYLGYTRHLLETENLYQELQLSAGLNSHWPMLPRYIAMLSKWFELGRPNQLDLLEISAIASVNADPAHYKKYLG